MYSLVADYSDDATRGSAFGWVQMARGLGPMVGGSLGVLLVPTTFLGVPGWRLAFHIVALVSAVLATLTWLLASDPRPTGSSKDMASAAEELVREAQDVVRVPTFQIIVDIAVPTTICCITYSLLYCTYPADRQRARMAALAASDDHDCDREDVAVATATAADGINQALLVLVT